MNDPASLSPEDELRLHEQKRLTGGLTPEEEARLAVLEAALAPAVPGFDVNAAAAEVRATAAQPGWRGSGDGSWATAQPPSDPGALAWAPSAQMGETTDAPAQAPADHAEAVHSPDAAWTLERAEHADERVGPDVEVVPEPWEAPAIAPSYAPILDTGPTELAAVQPTSAWAAGEGCARGAVQQIPDPWPVAEAAALLDDLSLLGSGSFAPAAGGAASDAPLAPAACEEPVALDDLPPIEVAEPGSDPDAFSEEEAEIEMCEVDDADIVEVEADALLSSPDATAPQAPQPEAPGPATSAPFEPTADAGGAPEPSPGEPEPAHALEAGRLDPSAFVTGRHRVVLHTADGEVKRGALADVALDSPEVLLEPQAGGTPEAIASHRIKAIFFMLPAGERPLPPVGTKVRVTFRDGRQVAGFSADYAPERPGFFMVPADTRTHTARIWVYRTSVRQISVS